MYIQRVLITGSGGMLGNAVYPYFVERFPTVLATDKELSETWLEELDVRNTEKMARTFSEFKPDLVLHLAAETDLEFCETYPDIAEAVNSKATREIAKLAVAHDATLVYISTAGVFDGEKKGFYTEEDQPVPIMVYGQTKYDGEEHVREICQKYYVIRAGWMVGGGTRKDHKFVMKILDQIIEGRNTLHVVTDKWGTPTYTHDFAMNLFALLDTEAYGSYHMVCEGSGTRYDVAKEILNICGRDNIELVGVDSDFFKEEYFAPRPRSEMMMNTNLRSLGINMMRPWEVALQRYINREFPHAIAHKSAEISSIDGYQGICRRVRNEDRRQQNLLWKGEERRSGMDRRMNIEVTQERRA